MSKERIDIVCCFSSDPVQAEHLADKNYGLKVKKDPSILEQDVMFESWDFVNKKGITMYGAKYYYDVENATPVVKNHPKVKAKVA